MRDRDMNRDELLELKEEVDQHFPREVGETTLKLMDVNPYTLHAYWRVRDEDLHAARDTLGPGADGRLMLRIYDVTYIEFDGTNDHLHFDIAVHGTRNNWYIDLLDGGKSFLADLGVMGPEGRFVTIARSNVTRAPRDGQSEFYERRGVRLLPDGRTVEVRDICEADDKAFAPERPRRGMDRRQVNSRLAEFYGGFTNPEMKEQPEKQTGAAEETDAPSPARENREAEGFSAPRRETDDEASPAPPMERKIRARYNELLRGEKLPPCAPSRNWRKLARATFEY